MISFNFVAPLKMQSAKNIDFELSFRMAQNGLQRFNSVFGRILGVCLLLLPFCFLLWHANSTNARGNPPINQGIVRPIFLKLSKQKNVELLCCAAGMQSQNIR